MKSFFKLFIAMVAVAASLALAGNASAAMVAQNDMGNLEFYGYGAATFGMVTPNEVGGEAPPSTFATATDVRLTAKWGSDKVQAQWTKWIRDVDGQQGNITQDMAQLTWKPSPELRIDMGNLIYVPWGDRGIMWENYYTVDSIHQSKTYTGYIEDVNGVDIGYNVGGGIEVGVGIFTQGVVTGAKNAVNVPSADGTSAGSQANTYAGHLVWIADGMSLRAAFYSETKEPAGATWADSESASNTLISATFKIDLGVKIGVTFNTIDGDDYKDADPWTSISPGVRMPLGADEAGVELEMATNGGIDDKGEQADTMYARVFYQVNIGAGSYWQVEYDMKDDAVSTGSAITFNLKQSF